MSGISVSKKWSGVRKTLDMSFIVAATVLFVGLETRAAKFHTHDFYSETSGAQTGFCVRPPSGTPAEVLKRNGIRVRGQTKEGDLYALAKGINQVERLLGGPLPGSWRTKIKYVNSRGSWNQGLEGDRNEINVHRPLRGTRPVFDGNDVSAYMHEFGHTVGNADNQRAYREFRRNVSSCADYNERGKRVSTISGYAGSEFNEQFAEAFMVYVINPADLKRRCVQAYNYFSKNLFARNSAKAEARCGGESQEVREPRKRDSTSGGTSRPREERSTEKGFIVEGFW